MEASRFANPQRVAEASSRRKVSKAAGEVESAGSMMSFRSADETAPTPTSEPVNASVANDTTSVPLSDAKVSAPSIDKPSSPQEQVTENNRKASPKGTKPLPQLPRVAEIMKQQNLPEPPVILASSPGVTTPEIDAAAAPLPATTPPKEAPLASPSPSNEAAHNVKSSVAELVPMSLSPMPPVSTTKAKRSKAGKPCAIRLPADKTKSYAGYPTPLSLDDFKARLEGFEKAGYDTRGFGYWKDVEGVDGDTEPAQARHEFPDPTEQSQERQQRKFGVYIPDKKKWDDYVDNLVEEKLRALGVTSGDDEPAPTISRQLSSQISSPYPSLPMSPPIPSSSSASQHMWQNTLPFSAPFSPGASTANTSIGAVVSPVPSLGQQGLSHHMPRQSTFGFSFVPGQGPVSMPQPWSPQPMVSPQGAARGASPAMPGGGLKRQTSGFAHESPDSLTERQPTPRGQFTPSQSASRADQAMSWRSNFQPEQAQVSKIEKGDAAEEPTESESYADLASPKPQGHRHNISANLEREVENAQYYPGEYVNESREASPSRQSAIKDNASAEQTNGHRTKPSHASSASVSSRLNIAAKEFKYDPGSTQSRNFSLSSDAFMPKPPKAAKAADATSSVQFTTAHSHQGSVSLSNLNVAAPEFKPPAQKNFAFSSSWFNFSAKKPSEAPKVVDGDKIAEAQVKENAPTIGSKIFGNIADIVKPSKKSKAVPIVNPNDVASEKAESEHEDEDGRIVQSDARRKKGRFAGGDDDEVPRFAEPTPEPEAIAQPPPSTELRASPAAPSPRVNDEENLLPRTRPLALDYELDVAGNISDGSNVPWHGIESEDRLEDQELSINVPDRDLMTSPAAASDDEDNDTRRDARGLSPETPASRGGGPDSSRTLGDDDSRIYPSLPDIDAAMDYINRDNSDFGVEDKEVSPIDELVPGGLHSRHLSNKAPGLENSHDLASSPPDYASRGNLIDTDTPVANDNIVDWRLERERSANASPTRPGVSPVRKLNKLAEGSVSDWNDMLSSGEELRIPPQNQTNDAHVATLVEGLLRRHLAPFEKQLKDLNASMKRSSMSDYNRPRPFSAYEKSESDADDEDDTDDGSRLRSRGARSDRRTDQIKLAVAEAMAASHSDGFGQIEQEVKFRKAAENRADDLQRLLTLSEREIALFKESAATSEERVRHLEHERDDLRRHHRAVEEELRTKTLDFTAEVAALENTLDEYRTSSAKWREEIDSVQKTREGLQKTIEALKREAADHVREREVLNGKMIKVEEELSLSNSKLASERSMWDRKDQKQSADIESLQGKLAEAAKNKETLDEEISRLNQVEKDAIRNAVMLEETQKAKVKLESVVNKLNEKTIEHQTIVAHYEREASEAHQNTAVQVERTKSLMQTDVEIANKRVENVRADLETRLQMTKSELDNVRRDNDAVRSRYERSLNEAIASRKEALQEAADSSNARLQEEHRRFEQSLNELSSQHDRAMRNAIEDKQRSETHLNSSLKLSDAKVSHLEEKVENLEDRLSVAQSAAQAAAIAAKSAQSAQSQLPSTTATSKGAPTTSISTPSHLEKISPQALRESIVVLQEQLQERESRIESLESEISTIGRDAPNKLRERETEIGWLRELLGVRIDDLTDLVNNLQMEKFDRGAARNAAIRIKANLQMEQQEKNRVLHGVKPSSPANALPSLTDIQKFASPKAAQLTSAFNNWRKGGQTPSLAGLREAVNAGTPSRPRPEMPSRGSASTASISANPANPKGLKNPIAAAADANANKPTTAESFMSGLMTPPTSNLRRTPSTGGSAETARPTTPVRPGTGSKANASGSPGIGLDPTTPPLMRKGDYDLDAELGPDRMEFEGSDDEDAGYATEETAEITNLEPLGDVVATGAAE